MQYRVVPKVFGQLTNMFKHLYQELHAMGIAHKTLQHISLRKALLQRFGSPEVIDALFGEGVYQGIKSETGPYSQWRKLWSRVQKGEMQKQPSRNKAMEVLKLQIQGCLAEGWSPIEIGREVQMHLKLSGWLIAS